MIQINNGVGLKKIIIHLFIILSLLSCDTYNSVTNQEDNNTITIVSKMGQLSLSGVNIIDESGNPIALRGMSLFWSQWAPNYYNEETIKWLRDDWKCIVVRAAMGVESGGYLDNPEIEYAKVTKVIDACIKLGIYVIVDWHDHHAEDHLESAKSFFSRISKTYGDKPNIIYEIYNEPLNVSWVNTLKPYALSVINSIRKNDPDNLIIVGTPNWSQDVDKVIGSKIDDDKVMYSLHFYTGTHNEWLRTKAVKAISSGIPIFVSEYGISEASGNGKIDINETNLWASFMEEKNLSWCNWSVTNKDETSAILSPLTTSLYGWELKDLSEAGTIIRDYLIRMNDYLFE
jgi:endoglucanase